MFNLENIKGFTDKTDKMSSIVDYTDRSVWHLEMVQVQLFDLHEGLRVQDGKRSDGVGRDF
jgi:hypothetical protein